MAKVARRGVKKKKEKKNIPTGVAHIQSTFNNTIVTITDPAGNVVSWSSSGTQGFKGSRRVFPLPLNLPRKMRLKKLWNMACVLLMFMSKVRAQDGKRLSELSK